MHTISTFSGGTAFLSNFFTEPDGTDVEREFQAEKTWNFHDRLKIMNAVSPGAAKRLGRTVKLRSDWDSTQSNGMTVAYNVMHSLVFRKFWEHGELAGHLLDTEDAHIIEGNHWHDNRWGNCTCERCADIVGENWLGIILMDVRAVLL